MNDPRGSGSVVDHCASPSLTPHARPQSARCPAQLGAPRLLSSPPPPGRPCAKDVVNVLGDGEEGIDDVGSGGGGGWGAFDEVNEIDRRPPTAALRYRR